ncbi:ornithine cyclodeaminase [Polychaeton citri CBS 116435]|uniref:Ornithine cyclodeaminase n=1 Tax=Polychaeton citri CBS 116435 TaxID=1314669 RepID=A0A9P4URR5_9PEZI|nr:ornithine cyclodeaminase [Polychaeton citri CBS 116435]
MSGCIVLSDFIVHEILVDLPRSDIIAFKDKLEVCLEEFSTTEGREYQPEPDVVIRSDGRKTLFRPFTSPSSVGAKIVVDTAGVDPARAPVSDGHTESAKPVSLALHGLVVVCDKNGLPTGILNVEEVTGYRKSMNVMIPYMWRQNTKRIVMFRAGKQALWHLRLALALRGSEIERITVVNQSYLRAQTLVDRLQQENRQRWSSTAAIGCLDSSHPDYEQALKELLLEVDVVFCTVPTRQALFSSRYITSSMRGSPFISAIGSWIPEIAELDPEILSYRPKGETGSSILVNDRANAMSNSSEVLVEVGEVLKLLREKGTLSQNEHGHSKRNSLLTWLRPGFVVYKSIGLRVTDLAARNAILSLAQDRGVGICIPDF